jgi:hypothetical protein
MIAVKGCKADHVSREQIRAFFYATLIGALEALRAAGQQPHEFLARHVTGDWGDLDAEDRSLNNAAVRDGSRILSAYVTRNGERLWIITEAADDQGHRPSSCLLLPSEY